MYIHQSYYQPIDVHSMLICHIVDNRDIILMNYAEIRRSTMKKEKRISKQIHQTHT